MRVRSKRVEQIFFNFFIFDSFSSKDTKSKFFLLDRSLKRETHERAQKKFNINDTHSTRAPLIAAESINIQKIYKNGRRGGPQANQPDG